VPSGGHRPALAQTRRQSLPAAGGSAVVPTARERTVSFTLVVYAFGYDDKDGDAFPVYELLCAL
jgi:hypothetical protein